MASNEILVCVPNCQLVRYVIGRQRQTIRRIIQETSTNIYHGMVNGKDHLIIQGGDTSHRQLAKIKIISVISDGLIKLATTQKYSRLHFINSGDSCFMLQSADTDSTEFKVVLKTPSDKEENFSETPDCSTLSSQIYKVLQSVYEGKPKNGATSNIWSYFGRIHLTHVKEGEEENEFNSHKLLSHLSGSDSEKVTKWRSKFFSGICDERDPFNLSEWVLNRPLKYPSLHCYEYAFYSPSCRLLILKVLMEVTGKDDQGSNLYQNVPTSEPIGNIIKTSTDSSPGFFYLCGSTNRKAVVNVFQPDEELDFRFTIDSDSSSNPHDAGDEGCKTDEEAGVLFKYIQENLEVTQCGVKLPLDSLPMDFDVYWLRVSRRNAYSFTSENEEEFTVKLVHDIFAETSRRVSGQTVDIHLQYDEWDRMFNDGTWTPQNIVEKIPEFMKCAKSLARALKRQDPNKLVPPEIQALGEKGRLAYEHALKSGYTKNRRIAIMLIGQSRAGKTSLLKSLKGELFSHQEDSTDGVSVHRCFGKAEENIWSDDLDMPSEDSFRLRSEALAMVHSLKEMTLGDSDFNRSLDDDECKEEGIENNASKLAGQKTSENSGGRLKRQLSCVTDFGGQKSEQADSGNAIEIPFEIELPEGITDVVSNILQHPDKEVEGNLIYSITMDFAGQPVYQAIHPVLLSPKGIYILVHSLETDVHAQATPLVKQGSVERKVDDKCPMTNMDHLEFWMSVISSYWSPDDPSTDRKALELRKTVEGTVSGVSGSSVEKPKSKCKLPKKLPPVFLVCTHADKPFGIEEPMDTTRKILSYLKAGGCAKDGAGEHLVRAVFAVNNSVSGTTGEDDCVKKLRASICQVAKSLPQMNEKIPIRWLHFEKELLNLVEKENKKYISLEEAKNLALKCRIPSDGDELETVLKYLHNLKIVIYFKDSGILIIDRQWLLEMIVKVITVKPFEEWEDDYEELWAKLENDGILERALIDHVWENENTASSLLMIMEKNSLLCRWKKSGAPDTFLVPTMLMNSDAKSANDLLSDQKTSRTLVVRFKSAHLPLGIFPTLLVLIAKTCNEKWPDSPQPKFYHNFCRFYDVGGETGKSFDLVVTSDIKTISFSVINEQGIMGLPLKQLCRFIVEFLNKTLTAMCSSFPWMKNAEYNFCIRCPKCYQSSASCEHHKVSGCTRDACLHFITEEELRNQQPRCYRNHTSKSTYFEEEIYCDWFDVPRHAHQDEQEASTTSVVAEVVEQLALNEKPSTSEVSKSNEIVPYAAQDRALALPETTALVIAEVQKVIMELEPYKTSLKDPPADTVKKCRDICRQLKGGQRKKHIKTLRDYLPSGTTGPLEEESKPYEQLDAKKKQDLTRALCGTELSKRIIDEFGKSGSWDYFNRFPNIVEALLDEESKKRSLTVGRLYDVLVMCEANAVADIYL